MKKTIHGVWLFFSLTSLSATQGALFDSESTLDARENEDTLSDEKQPSYFDLVSSPAVVTTFALLLAGGLYRIVRSKQSDVLILKKGLDKNGLKKRKHNKKENHVDLKTDHIEQELIDNKVKEENKVKSIDCGTYKAFFYQEKDDDENLEVKFIDKQHPNVYILWKDALRLIEKKDGFCDCLIKALKNSTFKYMSVYFHPIYNGNTKKVFLIRIEYLPKPLPLLYPSFKEDECYRKDSSSSVTVKEIDESIIPLGTKSTARHYESIRSFLQNVSLHSQYAFWRQAAKKIGEAIKKNRNFIRFYAEDYEETWVHFVLKAV